MKKIFPYILILAGLVGITTSFLLTLDKIKLLENPGVVLPCNINPLISCGPVINTWQAEIFGVPNPMLGIVGFSAVLTIGVALLLGAVFDKRFWKFFTIGVTASVIFIHWLIFESIFDIGALCLYCMITWGFVWPLFFFTIIKNIEDKIVPLNKFESFLTKNRYHLFFNWYVLIVLVILFKFRDFFFN